MKILCIDVGRGTQDILLYDNTKTLENCISLIIHSRGMILQEALEKAIGQNKTPLFWGINMGGFPVFKYTQQFLQNGQKILATASAAKTFHDNLDFLTDKGFKIVSDQEVEQLEKSPNITAFETKDIALDNLLTALVNLGDNAQIDGFAIAVQDHGEAPVGISNRQFRFTQHRQMLDTYQNISQFGFKREQIPKVFTRMHAVASSLPSNKPIMIMDTGWAAILGALEDSVVSSKQHKLIVNIGNAHALAALLEGENILGIWEHHTSCLNQDKLAYLLKKLAEGTVTHDEIFVDGGHGAYMKEPSTGDMTQIEIIAVTGPNRMKFASKDYYLAAPHGNMMLSGSFGLLRAYQKQFGTS